MIRLFTYSSPRPVPGAIIARYPDCGRIRDSRESRGCFYISPESNKAAIERLVLASGRVDEETTAGVAVTGIGTNDEFSRVSRSLIDGDVLSFNRLATRILTETGHDSVSPSSSAFQREVIYRIITDHIDEFRSLGRLIARFEFIDRLIALIGDFVRYGIGADQIDEAFAALDDGERTPYSDKLHDMKLIMNCLEEIGAKTGVDVMDNPIMTANRVLEHISEDRDLLNHYRYHSLKKLLSNQFVILGFGNTREFTPQELHFIELLNSLCADIDIYVMSSREYDDAAIYAVGNSTVASVCSRFGNIEVTDIPDINSTPSSLLARVASDYAYEIPAQAYEDKDESVICTSIRSIDDRIGFICNEIIRLTREQGYSYRDIRIICADDNLMPRFGSIMKLFGMDMFIDHKIVLNNTPVFRYTMYLLQMPVYGFNLENTLRLLRTGIAGALPEVIDAFDNFCHKHNIMTEDRIVCEDYYVENCDDKYKDIIVVDNVPYPAGRYLYDNLVSRIIIPIFRDSHYIAEGATITQKAETLARHIDSKHNHISALVTELFERDEQETASALARGYKELMTLLASFGSEICDVDISQELFADLVNADMRNKSMGSIPLCVDSVEIVTSDNAYLTPKKVAFLIGATAENFPYTRVTDEIFTRKELERLSVDSGIDFPDKAESRRKKDFITSALILNSISDKLYLIHDMDSAVSSVYEYMSVNAVRYPDDCFILPSFGNCEMRRHDHLTSRIPQELLREITGGEMRLSVSRLEKFNKCHFRHAMEDILGIKERKDNTFIKADIMGTVIHAMFEKAVSSTVEQYHTAEEMGAFVDDLQNNPEKADQVADEAFEAFIHSRDGMMYMTEREFILSAGRKAKRIFKKSFPVLLREVSDTGYIPEDFELKINNMMEPIVRNDISFRFVGSIDRVDARVCEDGHKEYRILDYKTGEKKINLVEVLNGLQIQLFEYANALKAQNKDVRDVGYFTIGLKPTSQRNAKSDNSRFLAFAGLEDRFDTVTKYVSGVVERGCEEISSGMADARINCALQSDRFFGTCNNCCFRGSCGNDPNKPDRFEYELSKAEPNPDDIGETKPTAKDIAYYKMKEITEDRQDGE